jgi:hypothetical protein
MATAAKSETVTFRIRPEVKAALRAAAEREHRSLANMLEVMIRSYAPPVPRAASSPAWATGAPPAPPADS